MKNLIAVFGLITVVSSLLFQGGCSRRGKNINSVAFGDSLFLQSVPPQPPEETWKFVEELKAPLWTRHEWVKQAAAPGQADLSSGYRLDPQFPDPEGWLQTAYDDLKAFFTAGSIPGENGKYCIRTEEDKTLAGETFRMEISPGECTVYAGTTEGIRRGIFHLEDEMLRLRAPLLPIGTTEKKTFIKRRISRCFFGPIKRFPKMRDELMDEVDYYPDQYLNRLAHEGVNGLWLTIEFRDLVSTSFTPEAGKDAEKRLTKLKKTVDKCLKYGIRTYIFCIEPRAWDPDSPVIGKYPEMAGAPAGKGRYFCPMSETARRYLYESVNKIFRAVPGLGGMINITHGERGTTCLSAVSCTSDFEGKINCPRCSEKQPWEILHASLSAMKQGMQDAAPEAELISWLYMPQPQRFITGDSYGLAEWVYDLPAHTPEGVILQFNFESGVSQTVFDKLLVGGDYWISKTGPGERFEKTASIARENHTQVSAKIQTGCSHEVATIPFVPVPSLLYRKFRAMRDLGVTHTMLCWYFGNYPGVMNKAAGMLSQEPFPENEESFLHQLASVYWKKEDVSKVVEAWKHFTSGYENYPLVNLFQYYGPMHDGPVWPLLLKPADAPLSPTWQIGSSATRQPWPPSGDRILECCGEVLTLGEITLLAQKISDAWNQGINIYSKLEENYRNEPERLSDIGVAKALAIQFRSGYNILNFYLLREKMFRMDGMERMELLNQLSEIIKEEIALDEQLLDLCSKDSRLGFHSEAEGYKYFPEKIRWRMNFLKSVLANDVPELRNTIRRDEPLFPEYTGKKPSGPVAVTLFAEDFAGIDSKNLIPSGLQWQLFEHGFSGKSIKWASSFNSEALFILVSVPDDRNSARKESPFASVEVKMETQRLSPAFHFVFDEATRPLDPVHILGYPLLYKGGLPEIKQDGIRYAVARIPFGIAGLTQKKPNPLRINVFCHMKGGGSDSWKPVNLLTSRLILGSDNPADLGWLIFDDPPAK